MCDFFSCTVAALPKLAGGVGNTYRSRIALNVFINCHTSLSGSGPQYLSDLTHVYTPARSLCSSSDTYIMSTPNVKLKSYGQRSFAYHGPTTRNSLPLALSYQQESDCFKRALKHICFLSINELNTNVVFFYFHLPTINTTLVINKLGHLSIY